MGSSPDVLLSRLPALAGSVPHQGFPEQSASREKWLIREWGVQLREAGVSTIEDAGGDELAALRLLSCRAVGRNVPHGLGAVRPG